MDPISLIVAALGAGASAALTDTASDAVKSAYSGLKALLRRKFAGDRAAEVALDEIDQRPDADAGALEPHLQATGADGDEELLRLARTLMQLEDPQGAQAGKYNVTVSGGKGSVVGDNASVTMTFND